MLRLTYYELLKTFLKKRTYLGFLVVLVIVPLVEGALKLEGGRFLTRALRSLSQNFIFVGNLFNAWFVAQQVMNSLWVQIPLLIAFVAGDQLAGEATGGTYRLILIKPVSRTRIFFAKYIATVVYTVLFVSFLGVLSVGLALALFGGGDMIVLMKGILILPANDVVWRFIVGYILAAWTMTMMASFAFFFSSFVENAIGPIVGTMGILIVATIITIIPVESFDTLRDILFTKYINIWQKCFQDPVPWDEIRFGLMHTGAYIVASVLCAWTIFVRKDILS
jgi:ABC-2 type transport system permease protein